jgi:hypothetical protein
MCKMLCWQAVKFLADLLFISVPKGASGEDPEPKRQIDLPILLVLGEGGTALHINFL